MGLRSEVGDFLKGVEHGGRSAGGQESVGHQIHGDEVGDALDERRRPPHAGEGLPGFVGPFVLLFSLGFLLLRQALIVPILYFHSFIENVN